MISLGLKLAVSTGLKPISPEATYIAALTAAGASVTTPQRAAISTFMSGEIAAGRWDGHKRLYFPVWGLAAANAICMKSLTTGTFVGSIDHGSGYAKPNDSSSGMRANTSLPDIGVTKESWHFTVLVYELGGEGCLWGRDFNTDFSAFADYLHGEEGAEYTNAVFRVSNRTHISNGNVPRLLSIFGTANTVSIKNRNSYSEASIYSSSFGGSTNTVDFVDSNFNVMASESFGNLALASQSSKYGLFSFGNTMSDAQNTAYTLALKNLWETVTGLTLP